VMRLGVTAYYVDGLADFRTALTRLFERERDRGAVTNAMTMLHLLVLDQIASGRWAAAEESVRLGLELTATHHNELFRVQFIAYDGLRAASAGRIEEARRCAAEVTGWAGPRRIGLLLGFTRRIAVLVALAEADYEAAYAAALRIGPAGDFPPYAHQAVDGLIDLVEAAVHAGHAEQARAHVDAAVRLRLGDNSARLEALITAGRAMTAPDDAAGPLYETALAHPAFLEFPFEHNRIRLAYGMWLRRRRRHTDARDVLALAADAFTALGAAPWAERALTELRAAGATVKRSGRDTVVLSAQERRIAELAAAGHSNKQIAAQLFLSPRTVGAHLYRIFPKLGVTSRAGLGLALGDLADP
jgi:DNA-binding CsgD family transcriptional regulator